MSLLATIQISLLFIILATVTIWVLKYSAKNYNPSTSEGTRLNFTFIDFSILLILCSIFGYISQINLGTKDIKKSVWQGNYPGKQIELKFTHPTELKEIWYYSGLTNGFLDIAVTGTDGTTTKLDIENQNSDNPFLFMWIVAKVPESMTKISVIKFIAKTATVAISQLAILDKNNKPVINFSLSGNFNKNYDIIESDFISLFFNNSIMAINKDGSVWDEIYYVTSAYQLVNSISPIYVREHPPLVIDLIALSIKQLGMSPYSWRLPAYISGILLIIFVYIFAKQIFNSTKLASIAALLMSLDFMHFVFSRIMNLESILIVFSTATLFFLYRYFRSSLNNDYRTALNSLIIASYFWGLALASKWSALFMLIIFIVLIIYVELKIYNKAKSLGYRLLVYLIIVFILPISIYFLCYIPEFIISKQIDFYQFVLEQVLYAWHFQTEIMVHVKPHFYSSEWWSWFILETPFAIFRRNDTLHKLSTSIVLMGNPAIWWLGIISSFILLINYIAKRDRVSFFILLSIVSMYLPYALFKRSTFIYYFYFVTPLITLAITKSIELLANYSKRLIYFLTAIYIIYAIGLFILFYPVLVGETVSRSYIYNYLHWFPTWVF